MNRLMPILFFLFVLSSCDPGHVVILSNQSLEDKNIKVIVTDKHKIHYLDSIAIIDSVNALGRLMIAISKDSNANSYSFTLEKRKNAVLQQGIGGPDLTEKIIVDFTDTISLIKDKRITTKKEGISTAMTVRLE